MNDEIEYILNLTSNVYKSLINYRIGNENKETNTYLIRRSMCCYVEKIMGYVNDDFDYSKVYIFSNFKLRLFRLINYSLLHKSNL